MLVGNKCDMDSRVVTKEMGEKLAEEYKVPFFETSAKTGLNIKEVFEHMAWEIIKNKPAGNPRATQKLTAKEDPNKKKDAEGGCSC